MREGKAQALFPLLSAGKGGRMRQPGRDRNAACHLRTAPWRHARRRVPLQKRPVGKGAHKGRRCLRPPSGRAGSRRPCCFQGVAGPDHRTGQPPDTKKGPAGSGAFFIQSEAGASRRLSTCRPCHPCRPCRQAWQEHPSWVRAFRRGRIRWSAAGRPRKRRSAGRYGSPSWGR